jgi:branched-chain amino acid transport system ATP-binding protein
VTQSLQLRAVTKRFGSLVAVNGVDLEVHAGNLHGLIGPNGAGKTTVMRLISGFERPTRGRILFEGKDVTRTSAYRRARMGLVRTFQLNTLFDESTALENVMLAFCGTPRTSRDRRTMGGVQGDRAYRSREALQLLEKLGITHRANALASDLPHGDRRVLGIAMALALRPKLLLLDEPLTGMNPAESDAMARRIRAIANDGTTVLLIEHKMKTMVEICDTITVIDFGRKIAEGSPGHVINDRAVIKAYLGGAGDEA